MEAPVCVIFKVGVLHLDERQVIMEPTDSDSWGKSPTYLLNLHLLLGSLFFQEYTAFWVFFENSQEPWEFHQFLQPENRCEILSCN